MTRSVKDGIAKRRKITPYYEDIVTISKLDKMSVADKVRFHAARVAKAEEVYKHMDKLAISSLPMRELNGALQRARERESLIRSCISLFESPDFIKCRATQLTLCKQVMAAAEGRLKLFTNPLPVERIKHCINKEDMLLDLMVSVELSIEKMCESAGVCASQFFMAGKLLKSTRGISTVKFCEQHMGYKT